MRTRIAIASCLLWSCVDTSPPMAAGAVIDAGMLDAALGPVKPPLAAAASPVSGGVSSAGSAAKPPQPSLAGGAAPPPPMAAGDAGMPATTPARAPALHAPSQPGQLVITELMIDPATLSDTNGEWIELYNTSHEPFDLRGCELDDGGKSPHAVATSLRIEAHGYITIARSTQPGFPPSYVATLSLTNSADTVALRCGGVEIDRVRYDKSAGYALESGASLALDAAHLDAGDNDRADVWCASRDSYGPERGTPGQENPSCSASEDDAGEPDPDDD
jgi:hypothetical protein